MKNKIKTISNFSTLRYLYGITFTPMKTFQKLAEDFGDVICLKFWDESVYFVNEPEIIKHILKTNYENYPRGKSIADLKPLLGNGLFLSEGELWKSQHKLLQPAFHNSKMERFYAMFDDEVNNTINKLEKESTENNKIDLEHELKSLLFSLTVKHLISPEVELNNEKLITGLSFILEHTSNKRHNMRLVTSLFLRKNVKIFDSPKPKAALKDIHSVVDQLFHDIVSGKIVPGNLVKILIDEFNSGRIPAQQVKDEMQTILFAGYDTVAEGILWLIYFLSMNKMWSEEVEKEITKLGDNYDESKISLNDTPFLHACIKETLRLLPPAWSFYRTVKENDEIDDYYFPKNALIMISPYILHRNKKYWESADEFNPNRFLGETEINPFHYIPFGQGPHICVGNRLAMIEIQLITMRLLKKFKFKFVSPKKSVPDVIPAAIISSEKPVRVLIEKR